MIDPPRIRAAVRALVLDDVGNTLLVKFEYTNGTIWALPGGGIDDGETHHQALCRELREEIGLENPTIGAHLWTRTFELRFGDFDGQCERVHAVHVPAQFEPQPHFSWEQLNAERVFEMRWWSADELDEHRPMTAPRNLVTLMRSYLAIGAPATAPDVGA